MRGSPHRLNATCPDDGTPPRNQVSAVNKSKRLWRRWMRYLPLLACLLMAFIGSLLLTGCVAVVDDDRRAPASLMSDGDSSACASLFGSDWWIGRESLEGRQCDPESPTAAIYRDEEANPPSAQIPTSAGAQAGLFTPVWVIF